MCVRVRVRARARRVACVCLHPLPLIPQVTPTAALHSTERGTPPIGGEDTDEEDTLQPTQVDLSVTGVCSVGDGCECFACVRHV